MLDWLADHLAMIMFVSMFFVIFLGYPVAFIMGGLALIFALLGAWLGVFKLIGLSDGSSDPKSMLDALQKNGTAALKAAN